MQTGGDLVHAVVNTGDGAFYPLVADTKDGFGKGVAEALPGVGSRVEARRPGGIRQCPVNTTVRVTVRATPKGLKQFTCMHIINDEQKNRHAYYVYKPNPNKQTDMQLP